MRNYCSVTDLKDANFIEKLYDVFDDEMFILLKRNSPQYIGCPYRFGIEFTDLFHYSVREISSTQLQRREVLTGKESDWESKLVYVLLVNGSPKYIFFPFDAYIADRVYKAMKDTLHTEFLSRHSLTSVNTPDYAGN